MSVSLLASTEMLAPPPPIPPKSLKFQKQQLELLVAGKLKPKDAIDLSSVLPMLDQVLIKYRGSVWSRLAEARPESLYDTPRDLKQHQDDLDVQLRPKSVAN